MSQYLEILRYSGSIKYSYCERYSMVCVPVRRDIDHSVDTYNCWFQMTLFDYIWSNFSTVLNLRLISHSDMNPSGVWPPFFWFQILASSNISFLMHMPVAFLGAQELRSLSGERMRSRARLLFLQLLCLSECFTKCSPDSDVRYPAYSRASVSRTLMARLPRLFRSRSWVPRKNPIHVAADFG